MGDDKLQGQSLWNLTPMCPQAANLPALIFYYRKRTLETNCPNTTEDFPTTSIEYFATNPLSALVNVSHAVHRSYVSDNLPGDQIKFAVLADLFIHQHIYLKRWMQIARRNKRPSYECQECNPEKCRNMHAHHCATFNLKPALDVKPC